MPRLRTLYVGTDTVGETSTTRHILVLDGIDNGPSPEQLTALSKDLNNDLPDGVPPVLAFGFDVDLPESASGEVLELEVADHITITIPADLEEHAVAQVLKTLGKEAST